MKVSEYVENGGVRCPFCESYDLVGDFVETNQGVAFQKITCNGCRKYWYDTYTLTGVDIEQDEGIPPGAEEEMELLDSGKFQYQSGGK